MTTIYGFSACKNAFYLLEDKKAYIANQLWSEDVIEVSEELWGTYSGQPPAGKVRGADSAGMPCWTDAAAVSAEEQCASDENEKEIRLRRAEKEISRLNIIKEVGSLTVKEESRFSAWKVYLEKIYRTDPSLGKVAEWPSAPDV